jgi:hypothetical protein
MSDTVIIVAIVGLAIVGLLAWESYEASQNSTANQLGKLTGGLLGSLL